MKFTLALIVVCWSSLLWSAPMPRLPSEDLGSDAILERLYTVRKELKKQSVSLKVTEGKSAALRQAIRTNSSEAEALEKELVEIKGKIAENQREVGSTNHELKLAKSQLKNLLNSNRERFKQIFYQTVAMEGIAEAGLRTPTLIDVTSLDQKAKYLFLLKKASEHDVRLMQKVQRAKGDYLERLAELEKLNAQAKVLLAKAEKNKQLIDLKNSKLLELRVLNNKEKNKLEQALNAIKAQEAKLQSILYSIIKKVEQQESSRGLVQRTRRDKVPKPREVEHLEQKYDGSGIGENLLYPVKAELIASKRKQGQSSEVWGNILRFEGEQNGVYAVSSGMVRFKGNLGSYQKDSIVVILDHGKRQYSVYGGMNVTAVNAGDKVSAGELLGYLPVASGSFELLFDLRFSGKSVPLGKFLPKYR